MTITPKLIFIDGIDRIGKDSVIRAIHKKTKYKHILVNRGPISYLAYHNIFSRPCQVGDYINLLTPETISIVLLGAPSIIKKRFEETNEPDLPVSIEHAQDVLKLTADFASAFVESNIFMVLIDELTVEELADKIIQFVGL
jgi:adenylate kinase